MHLWHTLSLRLVGLVFYMIYRLYQDFEAEILLRSRNKRSDQPIAKRLLSRRE
jgi:hypothetical protein